jgi:transporter family protein
MSSWLPVAILALFSFGCWGFFSKLALLYIDAKSALVLQTGGVLIIGVLILGMMDFKPATADIKGLGFGLLTGIAYGIGCLFYLIAADRGKLVTVVTLTALYPLITIVLSYFFLQETINLKQTCGILLALVAIILMSS